MNVLEEYGLRYRVLLIGNGPSALKGEAGSAIDTFDGVVARFNEFLLTGYERHVGTRTDEWITWKVFEPQAQREYARVLATTQPPATTLPELIKRYPQTRRVSQAAVEECRRRMGYELPSSGAIAAMDYILQGWEVLLWGFDFFQAKKHHYGDGGTIGNNHSGDHELRLFRGLLDEGLVRMFDPAAPNAPVDAAELNEIGSRSSNTAKVGSLGDREPLFRIGEGGVRSHLKHVQRYTLAAELVRSGMTVLDVGCGAGIGTEILARAAGAAGRVVGIERSKEAAAEARARVPAAKIEPAAGDRLPVDDASADVVVCFDGLDQGVGASNVVRELARALRPGGTCVACVRAKAGRGHAEHGGMSAEDATALLAKGFGTVRICRQRFLSAAVVAPLERMSSTPCVEETLAYDFRGANEPTQIPEQQPAHAAYYLLVCAHGALSEEAETLVSSGRMLVDDNDARAYEHTVEKAVLKRRLAVLERGGAAADLEELRQHVEPLKRHIMILEGGVTERDTEIARLRQSEARHSADALVAREERDIRAKRLDEILRELEEHKRRLLDAQSRLTELERLERRAADRFREADELVAAAEMRARRWEEQERRLENLAAGLRDEKAALGRKLEETESALEHHKQHVMRLEGGVAERDEHVRRIAQELGEIKQSGALRIGRAISRLLPTGLKRSLYNPLRRAERSDALEALSAGPSTTNPNPPAVSNEVNAVKQGSAGSGLETKWSPIRFSIVVPVYNHAQYLPGMIDSLLAQTRPADEIILVDDLSPDPKAREALRRYEGRPGVRVIFNEKNVGISAATNIGIAAAKGTHIAFVDCDDLLEPEALALVEQRLREDPGLDFVYSNRIDMDENGVEIHRWDFTNRAAAPAYESLLAGMFTSHLKVISASALRDIGLYKSRYDLSQDYDIALRLAERHRLGHLNAFVYRHRVHRRQQSQVNNARQEAMTLEIRKDSYRRAGLRDGSLGRMVSIIMLTMNRAEITKRAIEAILRNVRGEFELIVFDNGSNEATLSMLAGFERDARVRVIRAGRNYGVSGGRRRAAKRATGDYLFFLDSDIVIEDPDLLVKLLERLEEEPTAAACCCKVIFPDGSIQFNGGALESAANGRTRFALLDGGRMHDDLAAMLPAECDWIPGGATMWRREMHERFEPSDRMLGAFEDNEVCLRISRAGGKLLNCPTAAVTHYHHMFRDEQDESYMKARYDHERIITSMGVLWRDHGVLIDDDGLYRMLGMDPADGEGIRRRIEAAAAAGRTNEDVSTNPAETPVVVARGARDGARV